jgi:hypothetical protein
VARSIGTLQLVRWLAMQEIPADELAVGGLLRVSLVALAAASAVAAEMGWPALEENVQRLRSRLLEDMQLVLSADEIPEAFRRAFDDKE